MKSREIRSKFLDYFTAHGHQKVKSSSLIPAADPTLLFTNAGMVQFKDNFLGAHDAGYRRATTCQKCVRAGGKHNDLENVGFTARHHTFFEMLGNFSFGDYFKKDAIAFAWELLTKEFALPKDRLRVSVYNQDDEAFDLWKKQGIPGDLITRLGEKDNFWAMGDTGPCGPCTEIHYDWGKEHGCGRPDCAPGCEHCARFLEIWNLVFMQFNRDSAGKLNPLPKPSVDTGSGLERVTAVLQGVFSNYDTDLFAPIFAEITGLTKVAYGEGDATDASMRVISDHIRASSFLIADGVVPSNEGRGYVLRRILRRAIRHGKKLGQDAPFIHRLVGSVSSTLGDVYPELVSQKKMIEVMIHEEETRFHETLHRGMGLLDETIQRLSRSDQKVIPGAIAFKLYDTFGFPLDLIDVIGAENKLSVNHAEFQELMEKQRSQSVFNKGDDSSTLENIAKALEATRPQTQFLGYEALTASAKINQLFSADGQPAQFLRAGDAGFVVVDQTPFYAESGGQIGDKGTFKSAGTVAEVESTFKIAKAIVHRIRVTEGTLKLGQESALTVDETLRRYTAINHTATHMLHAVLRTKLGERVKQAGSLVDPTRLRFDFTFPKGLTEEERAEIENLINEEIQKDDVVSVREMGYDDAIKSGALAFFDEKYGDKVRVVRVGSEAAPFSVELCGGTHLKRTSEIGFFKILSESSVSSGVRRIEAVTSRTALKLLQDRDKLLTEIEARLKVSGDAAAKKVDEIVGKLKSANQEIEKLKMASALGSQKSSGENALWSKKIDINAHQLVMENVPGVNPKILRTLVDQVRDKLKEKVIVLLANENEGKVFLCLGLSKDLSVTWSAATMLQPLAALIGGTGGGKPDFAQAGGTKAEAIPEAFEKLKSWVRDHT